MYTTTTEDTEPGWVQRWLRDPNIFENPWGLINTVILWFFAKAFQSQQEILLKCRSKWNIHTWAILSNSSRFSRSTRIKHIQTPIRAFLKVAGKMSAYIRDPQGMIMLTFSNLKSSPKQLVRTSKLTLRWYLRSAMAILFISLGPFSPSESPLFDFPSTEARHFHKGVNWSGTRSIWFLTC